MTVFYGVESNCVETSSSTKFYAAKQQELVRQLGPALDGLSVQRTSDYLGLPQPPPHFGLSHWHLEVHAANISVSSIRTAESLRRRGGEAEHHSFHHADETRAVESNPLPPRDVLDARILRAVPICRRAIKSDDGVSLRTNFSYPIFGDALIFEKKSYASASAYRTLWFDGASGIFDAQESP